MRFVPRLTMLAIVGVMGWASKSMAEVSGDTARAMARNLGQEGLLALDRGDLPTALDCFNRAYTLHSVPTLALWTGRVLAKSGKLVAASERLREAARLSTAGGDQEVQLRAQREAAAELQLLTPRIPSLRIEVAEAVGAGSELFVDGVIAPTAVIGSPMPIDPGDHAIELRVSGRTAAARTNLTEGEHRVLELRFDSAAAEAPEVHTATSRPVHSGQSIATTSTPSPSNLQRNVGWVSIGIGAAGLATWGVSGALLLRQRAALERNCVDGRCAPEYHGDLERFRTTRAISTVGFIAGLAGLGAGTVVVLTAQRTAEHAAVARRTNEVRWFGGIGIQGIIIGGDY